MPKIRAYILEVYKVSRWLKDFNVEIFLCEIVSICHLFGLVIFLGQFKLFSIEIILEKIYKNLCN